MRLGDTFRFSPEIDEHQHLWVIISDPKIDPEQVLIVSFTTWTSYKDQTCIVLGSEHDDISHRSCVAYNFAMARPLSALLLAEKVAHLNRKTPAQPDLVRKIQEGAAISPQLARGLREILVKQGFIV